MRAGRWWSRASCARRVYAVIYCVNRDVYCAAYHVYCGVSDVYGPASRSLVEQGVVREAQCKATGCQEGRYKAPWKREFKPPWREAGPPNHHNDKVDSDQ